MAALGSVSRKAATPDECHALTQARPSRRSAACYQSLAAQHDHYLRAEGYWGLGMYQEANNQFREAVAQDDRNANYRVRWGRLMHERFNNTEAEKLFQEALQRDPKNAQAYLGLALVSADGYDSKAVKWAAKALELDPQSRGSPRVDGQSRARRFESGGGIEAGGRGPANFSRGARRHGGSRGGGGAGRTARPIAWLEKIRQVNPTYGEGCAIIAHHLLLNYRYEDAVAYYRKAVELDPQLWSARSALGVNLMRLGQEDEARRQLEMCYDNGFRDAATVNTLRLLDSYKNFITFKDGTTILRLHKKEAELLRPYFECPAAARHGDLREEIQDEASGSRAGGSLPRPRGLRGRTMGMPGLGALGVTFGEVVAMDSPSGRKPGDFHWGSHAVA